MPVVFALLILIAGCGSVVYLAQQNVALIDEVRTNLARWMGQTGHVSELSLHGPEFWLAMVLFAVGFSMLWSVLGVLPVLAHAVGAVGTMLGGAMVALFRSTAFHIVVGWVLFYVGVSMFTLGLVREIHREHILSAAGQLDLRPISSPPAVSEQIRRFRDLIDEMDGF
ncbi:MAG: hypothetical protein AAGD23_01590 [Pseudomonadota bacterium]